MCDLRCEIWDGEIWDVRQGDKGKEEVYGARRKDRISFVYLFLPCALCLEP